jgi:hypothetical protein
VSAIRPRVSRRDGIDPEVGRHVSSLRAARLARERGKMNDLVIQNVVVIPVLWRNGVSASSARLRGMDLTGWDSTLWRLAYWYNQA